MSTKNTATTDEPVGVERLRLARERAAARAADNAASAELPVLQPGDIIHGLSTSGLFLPRHSSIWGGPPAVHLTRGVEVEVDAEMIAADTNRHGQRSWTVLALDPEAQVRRWGSVMIGLGPAPEGIERWTHGDARWADERERARLDAHAQRTDAERRAALAEVHRRFGVARPENSFTRYISAVDRAEEADRKARLEAARAEVPYLGTSSEGGGGD